jgi:D-alanyl-D-alanine carboxypeptidase
MKNLRLFLLLTVALVSCQPTPNNMPATAIIYKPSIPDTPRNLETTRVSSLPSPTSLPTTAATPNSILTQPPPSQDELAAVLASKEPTPSPTTLSTETPTVEVSPTITPSATIEPTATYWPTVTRQVLSAAQSSGLVACQNRVVSNELLLTVTQQFPLPEFYQPPDLVSLTDYFGNSVTLNQPLYVRQIVINSLQDMVAEMQEAGLRPSIISAYRSYQEQALAWQWWNSQYPDRVAIMSARPGRSEHQLGTTVDFGSPELNHLFHVDFANTAEGLWLADNAHRFGFTLSYPANSYDISGFKYEPWHYRYVGQEMADSLFNTGQILTSWQIVNLPPPCIP